MPCTSKPGVGVTEPGTFTVTASAGAARAGTLTLAHGTVKTPTFMPVGTRASVKALDSADLAAVGAQMVLANTYHLMLRPGADRIGRLGGLHRFMAWDGPILTDSGGFQVFSLDARVSEEGVRFRSTYDGSAVLLTPEEATRVQQLLGADVAMVLDDLVGLPAPPERVRAAMERTLRWAERARGVHTSGDQVQFGIVQGGVDADLRARAARAVSDLGFRGIALGGLSVGESAPERNHAIEAAVSELPVDRVRYVMGLGDSEGVLDAVARGCDLFDCVWPTRLARHGKVLTGTGDFNVRRAEFQDDPAPLDAACECSTCHTYSRAYLNHLVRVKELAAHRLLSIHNLHYTLRLLSGARAAIEAGDLAEYRSTVIDART